MSSGMSTVADAVAARLRAAGVTHLFGMPGGGSNLDLVDAAERAGIRFVLTATETGGALAAVAQAEISGRPGVCLTTLGPGAASVTNGVACAYLDRAPLLVFTDSRPSASASEHQRIDQHALFVPITKSSAVLTPETAVPRVAEALCEAITPPFGPVHLECPGDVLSVEYGGPTSEEPGATSVSSCAGAEPSALRSGMLARLERARKPLLIVGLGARRTEDAAAIRRLCERRGVPALVTYKAKGVVPDDHPWFGGVFTNGVIERDLVARADLLVGIGLDPVELIPRPWSYSVPIVSCAPWRMDERHVPFAAQQAGPVADVVAAVDSAITRSSWTEEEIAAAVALQREKIAIPVPGVSAQQVVATAAERLAPIARVTIDAGAHMFPSTMAWPVREPNGMLISNGLSTMGFALPAAIGAALLDTKRPVVALTGDGGLLMCLGELATAVRERLHIIVLLFADQALSLIDIKQQQRRLASHGVRLGSVSWQSIAEGLGAAASSASTPRDLDRALDQALKRAGPTVVEARIDPANYRAMLAAIRGSS